jgi:very-short-patch-repair endonuclease
VSDYTSKSFALERNLEEVVMNKNKNPSLTENSQKLRRDMTKEEKRLWYDFLKKLPVTFNRQKVIGRYIVDFYCASTKTVIELDGSQHYEKEGKIADMERDAYLKSLGITVLRYSNYDVCKNFETVCADILQHIDRQ